MFLKTRVYGIAVVDMVKCSVREHFRKDPLVTFVTFRFLTKERGPMAFAVCWQHAYFWFHQRHERGKKKQNRELHHPVIDNFSMPHCVSAFLSDYDLIKEHWVIIMTNWMNRNKMNDIYILNSHYWLNNLVYLGFLTRLSLGFAGFFCFFKIFYTFPHATTC